MYYNRFLRCWVFDATDYFLISCIVGSLLASYLKEYLSEKTATERLRKSIIKESRLIPLTPKQQKERIQKVYKFALENPTVRSLLRAIR
jgi:hypothetical protein